MGKDLKGRDLGKGFYQRKNGMYSVRYVDAYGKRISLYHPDLKELKKMYNTKMYELDNHLNMMDENITVDEWYEKWLTVYKRNAVRESTLRLYKDVYRRMISPTLGRMKLNAVRKIHVQNLINELHEKMDYSWQVLDKVRRILNDMYGRAIEDDFAIKNPTKGVRIPKDKGENYHVLTKDEQALFFESAAGTYYDNMFNVAVNTGLRPGELFALTRDDLDMKKKVIHVRKTLLYAKFEGETEKSFRIGPPKTIQSYLGHASLEMTMNLYVHTTDTAKREEIELLEQNINILNSPEYIDNALQKTAVNDNIVRMPILT